MNKNKIQLAVIVFVAYVLLTLSCVSLIPYFFNDKYGKQNVQLEPISKLSPPSLFLNEVYSIKALSFEHLFSSYKTVKKQFNRDFDGYIDNFGEIYTKLIDKKDYRYKHTVSPYVPKKSTLNHVLMSIKNVDRFDIPEDEKQLLRMVMFFHDLGKTVGEPHEYYSKIMCRKILEKLEFDETKIKLIEKLVYTHNEIGKYPNQNPEMKKIVNNMSPKELYYLYYVATCDELGRVNFDTKKRKLLRFKIYSILSLGHRMAVLKLDKKLDYIHTDIRENFGFLIKANWDLFYRLKEFFFDYEYEDLNFIKHISCAV